MKRFLTLLISSIAIAVLACCLLNNYSQDFKEIEQEYYSGSAISLKKGFDEKVLANVLVQNSYVDSRVEAEFIASSISRKFEEGKSLANINDLKKRAWQIMVTDSLCLPESMKARLSLVRSALKQDVLDTLTQLTKKNDIYLAGKGTCKMEVYVDSLIKARTPVKMLFGKNRKHKKGIKVIISNHSTVHPDGTSILGYGVTDEKGRVVFGGLDADEYYSVLPVDSKLEFGSPKGTPVAPLAMTKHFDSNDSTLVNIRFSAIPLSFRLFPDSKLKLVREDKRITVRSPREYRESLCTNIFLVIALFWALAFFVHRKNRAANLTLLSILMLIAGTGVVNMYGLADPLVDTLLGAQNAKGVIMGLVIACLLVNVDVIKFYQDKSFLKFDILLHALRWLTLPYRQKVAPLARAVGNPRKNVFVKCVCCLLLAVSLPLIILNVLGWSTRFIDRIILKTPKGSGYLLAAIVITAMLFSPLGTEVGGMKVNLNLGIPVQPSEVAKFLLVLFMAAFFCEKAPMIISYSRESSVSGAMFTNKLRLMMWSIAGIAALMMLYLILSDMGPALVILVTFVLFYSMIKSTVAVKADDRSESLLKRILSCDFAVMLYGILSFMLFVWFGKKIGGDTMGLVSGLCWFPCWIIFFYLRRQIQESAIMFNAILSLFLFGGMILGACGFESEAERFDDRMEMCSNTWGVIKGFNGSEFDATSNSQVANGLWGLASGGMTGQGAGNGMPQFIPAFNTDMVLMSFGENMGFISVVLILLLYALLLWQTIRVGYVARHGFALYLCMGIAIVTGVQLLTIVMGALGLIPLTGVTVPLMSYGMSSLIMNMTAFGLVVSILAHDDSKTLSPQAKEELGKNVARYNYPIALLSVVGIALFAIVIGTFFSNMVLNRSDVMVRPIFAESQNGSNVVEYNPRLLVLADKMKMGNIYDRNGLILATHDKSLVKDHDVYAACDIKPDTLRRLKRYYPFGEHMFFMLGDYNTKLMWNYRESDPIGYLAENQHLSELRGYDNRYRVDEKGRRVKEKTGGTPLPRIHINSENVRRHRFMPAVAEKDSFYLRDYSALVPYLKDGYNGEKVKRFNERKEGFLTFDKVEPKDIHLTVDAQLQVKLQKGMVDHIQKNFHGGKYNKVRASVVILDAEKGDLLASANYPLPDSKSLTEWFVEQKDGKEQKYYTDNYRKSDWKSFSDRDLGLTYQTAPGSTAKVMSSLAYYKKYPCAAEPTYYVDSRETIYSYEPVGHIDIRKALRHSSNCYFVNLVNDKELYPQLAYIYGNTGVRVSREIPYCINYSEPTSEWINRNVLSPASNCISEYRKYDEERNRGGKRDRMYNKSGRGFPDEWSWAWGQNGIEASPLTMARVISIVANDGKMPVTRYLKDSPVTAIGVINKSDAEKLSNNLKFTALEHDKFGELSKHLGGKTGTPERNRYYAKTRYEKINDGWYICFIETSMSAGDMPKKLAVAVRMERIHDGMSGKAVKLTKEVVIKTLRELNYMD